MATVYTIGHSNHALETFLNLLRLHGIEAVVDVRSHPYSRFNPQYRRDALREALEDAGVEYAFLGRELGARSDDPSCWDEGKVQYSLLAQTCAFQSGLDAVAERATRQCVALLCAEKDPLTCHRTVLVCRELAARDLAGRRPRFAAQHIHADGRIETQAEADARLVAETGADAPDLFRRASDAVEEAYRRRAAEIAWSSPHRGTAER